MPLKWTAPEAVHFGRFTTQSDVWSYGVLLWEAFSHGQMPYPHMDNRKALKYVDEGNRMSEPKHTPPGVYDIHVPRKDRERIVLALNKIPKQTPSHSHSTLMASGGTV